MREFAEATSFRVRCRRKGSSFPKTGGELPGAALCWKPIRNTGPRSSATAVSTVPASEALLSRSGSEAKGPDESLLFLPYRFPADSKTWLSLCDALFRGLVVRFDQPSPPVVACSAWSAAQLTPAKACCHSLCFFAVRCLTTAHSGVVSLVPLTWSSSSGAGPRSSSLERRWYECLKQRSGRLQSENSGVDRSQAVDVSEAETTS